ncbi:MAG: quinone-dependent dihydroorotate dehydrogenase [Planctomycetota bacterium]
MLYDYLFKPILFRMDPERAHHLALGTLARAPTASLRASVGPAPEKPISLWDLEFRNPLGLAAGFDKNGIALDGWGALGFGFIEIGTVTRHAQPGNPKPRIFRLPSDRALINRLGFPNDGADVIAKRLGAYRSRSFVPKFPIGVNIGKSKTTPLEEAAGDYLYSFQLFHELGDFFVVNVSSPNTPGLRELQHPDQLRPILRGLKDHDRGQSKQKPLLVKIAPDLTDEQLLELLALIEEVEIDGIVATNTTIDHSSVKLDEKGGLSGAPVRARSTEVVARIAKETNGRLPIVAVGGVFTADDYQEKLDAGASLVEIYTGFVYQGPRTVRRILGS